MARILLADDDAATRDLVRRALEADGHTVHVTQDGSEALDCVEGASAQKFGPRRASSSCYSGENGRAESSGSLCPNRRARRTR